MAEELESYLEQREQWDYLRTGMGVGALLCETGLVSVSTWPGVTVFMFVANSILNAALIVQAAPAALRLLDQNRPNTFPQPDRQIDS